MKTRMRISPFHVKMTLLKTQIEKRENIKERRSHYLTNRTVRFFCPHWRSLEYAEIMGARSERKQCSSHRKYAQNTDVDQWMKFWCPQVYARWNASMNNNRQWSILLVEISYLLCSACGVHLFLRHVLLVKNLIKFPWTFFVRKGEQCDVLIWYLHRKVNIVYLNGKIIHNYVLLLRTL